MVDETIPGDRSGVVLAPVMTEVVGVFPSNAAIEAAVGWLAQAGFDRADLSLPVPDPSAAQTTPETAASPVMTDDDRQQARTLGTSMAAATAAIAAVGITVATGGAAAAGIAAAVIGGGVAGAAANAVAQGSEGLVQANREMAGAAGELRLSVRVDTPERRAAAEAALRAAGGQQVVSRER
jgi:hypothetical protein